jgi:heme oxygenase
MFFGFFHPLENAIQQHLSTTDLNDINERRKAAAILHDLKTLGFSASNISQCKSLPPVKNSSQAFGALYVLEGSTLGGKMIARMLLNNNLLSLSEESLTFFAGYKEETGSKWKRFLEAFNRQGNAEEVVKSANDTFSYLKSWMQRILYNE